MPKCLSNYCKTILMMQQFRRNSTSVKSDFRDIYWADLPMDHSQSEDISIRGCVTQIHPSFLPALCLFHISFDTVASSLSEPYSDNENLK